VAINNDKQIVAQGSALMRDFGDDHRAPSVWKQAMERAVTQALAAVDSQCIRAIAVDGTSGTMLPVNADGSPVGAALMYNDPVNNAHILDAIAAVAPTTSAAHGATSGLARFIALQTTPDVAKIIHQADWLAGQFSDRFDISDANNALKTGYDSVACRWPEWISGTGANPKLLPGVVAPGAITAKVADASARRYGLTQDTLIVAGTTDGCASFLATGASQPGDAVTALGTTMTVKMLSNKPLFAPQFGLYSHRMGDTWLAGGASNSGGNVLLHYFDADTIATLSKHIDPSTSTGFEYYPLVKPGERFPVNDVDFPPRVTPRPASDVEFLKALFEGMTNIESMAYARLADLGAPPLKSLRSVGGGARNKAWTAIRARKLNVPFKAVLSGEAAMGSALLALSGANAIQST
jgi:sugar (pentulose or hexulose) kinase